MALDDDIKQIKSDIADLEGRPLPVGRTGLYILTIIGMLGATRSCKILEKYENMIFPPVVSVGNPRKHSFLVYGSTGGVAFTLIGKIIVEKPPRAERACHWC